MSDLRHVVVEEQPAPDGSRALPKVFCLGVHRTGTASLMKALRQVGYRTSHWEQRAEVMADVNAGEYRLSVMNDYDAISDFPIPCLYRGLAQAFPAARFVLTVRDVDTWLESVRRHTIGRVLEPEEQLFYGRASFDTETFTARFTEHNAAVRSFFRERPNLLVMDVCAGEGWSKLGEFLALSETCQSSFPWLNRS